jgi:hypothetical protein
MTTKKKKKEEEEEEGKEYFKRKRDKEKENRKIEVLNFSGRMENLFVEKKVDVYG